LYLIMSEESLGRGYNAGERYALGDVPDEPPIADGRREGQRQDSGGRTGRLPEQVPRRSGRAPSSKRPSE
jgi:hypothetical protein